MHIAILGAGSLGTLMGARLWLGGEAEVTLVALEPLAENVAQRGVRIIESDGTVEVAHGSGLCAVTDVREIDDEIDYLIVAVKTTDLETALLDARAIGVPIHCAVTLQNGIRPDAMLKDALGSERVIGGVTMEGAATEEPGVVHHILAGDTFLGEFDRRSSERVDRLLDQFHKASMQAAAAEDILAAKWTKFVQSCAASGVCGATRLGYAPATITAAGAELYVRLLEEGIAVMRANGMKPGPFLGDAAEVHTLDAMSHDDAVASVRIKAADLIARGYTGGTSLLRDLESGYVSEADYLMGDMVRFGERAHIATPVMRSVYLSVAAADQSR